MLLAIDVGNTNTVFAVYDGQNLKATWRIKTDSDRTSDEYTSVLVQLFFRDGVQFGDVTDIYLSSVVPGANAHIQHFAQDNFGFDALQITSEIIAPYIHIKLPKPEEVGADRLVNAVSVLKEYQVPAIVVDFGTATTFDVIDETGAYCGGVIAPGVNLSVDALHAAAAKLPKISIHKPENVIGHDTVSAMRSGVYFGYLGLIEGTLTRVMQEMTTKPTVIATGGLASLYAEGTDMIDTTDDMLTLRGLVHLHDLQVNKSKMTA